MAVLYNQGRREFCKGFSKLLVSGSVISTSSLSIANALSPQKEQFDNLIFSAASDKQGKHYLLILNKLGVIKHQVSLPSRAHHIASHAQLGLVAVPARRPGTQMCIIDINSGKMLHNLSAEPGFHFYGHALFSRNGRYLYTTENHIESGEGKIVIRDVEKQFAVSQIFSSYGIGPHELILSQDENTIIVANGGIETHPDSGRTKLNLDSMSPSLVYINHYTGELMEQVALPATFHQLSIRHIDVNNRGQVAIAMQFEGDKTEVVPLVAIHDRGSPLKALWAPEFINHKMQHYCGSVRFNQSGSVFAVTSPRGNIITFWDALNAEYISSFECEDVCGVSQAGKHDFVFSNGLGEVYKFDFSKAQLERIAKINELNLDNHLS